MSWTDEKERIIDALGKTIGVKKGALLDIGAGNGIVTHGIAGLFDRVVAVEPSERLFAQLDQRCKGEKFTLLPRTFEHATFDQKFDVILASHSFQFIKNPAHELARIKSLLKDSGVFILINLNRECDYWKMYSKYRQEILGSEIGYALNLVFEYELMGFLNQHFTVRKDFFDAWVDIPSVDDYIGLFDFFYDIKFSAISKDALARVKKDLHKTYGDGPVKINFEQAMYICSL